MAFKVRLFHGSPDYESLHVAKLTCFPLERRDYKPYSQARVCFAPDGLHLQLLAFEAEPLPESSMMAFFSFAEKVPPLALSLSANGRFSASLACTVTPVEAAVHTFTGEDLQGVYWGGNIQIPQKVLTRCVLETVMVPFILCGAAAEGSFSRFSIYRARSCSDLLILYKINPRLSCAKYTNFRM